MFSFPGPLVKCGIIWDNLGRSTVSFSFNINFLREQPSSNTRMLKMQERQSRSIIVRQIYSPSYTNLLDALLDEKPIRVEFDTSRNTSQSNLPGIRKKII